MKYYLLEPEVAGALGDDSMIDDSVHPNVVSRLQYEIYGWLGDDIVESTPCFIVTERLSKLLAESNLSGFRLADVDITLNEQAEELEGGPIELPPFRWLQLVGRPKVDDFGPNEQGSLVASEDALALLRQVNLNHCDIKEL
jgi:hypothetical protein